MASSSTFLPPTLGGLVWLKSMHPDAVQKYNDVYFALLLQSFLDRDGELINKLLLATPLPDGDELHIPNGCDCIQVIDWCEKLSYNQVSATQGITCDKSCDTYSYCVESRPTTFRLRDGVWQLVHATLREVPVMGSALLARTVCTGVDHHNNPEFRFITTSGQRVRVGSTLKWSFPYHRGERFYIVGILLAT